METKNTSSFSKNSNSSKNLQTRKKNCIKINLLLATKVCLEIVTNQLSCKESMFSYQIPKKHRLFFTDFGCYPQVPILVFFSYQEELESELI